MPDDRIKISEFSTPVSLNNDDVIVIVQNVGGVKTTYKAPLTLLATQLLKNMQFASDLQTTNKAIIGAINEVAQGGGGASTLNDLTDVTITNPSNGQVITYNAQTGKWVNGAGAEITLVNNASGAIATFSDGAAGLPLKSCKVEIKPKQASGTPTPSNPLPISGTDTVIITQTGKNLVADTIDGYTVSSNGSMASSGQVNSLALAPIKAGVQYTITTDDVTGFVGGYFTEKPTITSTTYNNSRVVSNNKTFTAPITGWVAFRMSYQYATPQLEVGSTATTYEAYTATTKTVSLPETVYGGEVDVIGGSGESTHEIIDLGDLSWTYTSGDHSRMTATLTGSKGAPSGQTFKGACSIYKPAPYNSIYNHTEDKIIGISDTGTVWVYDSDYTDADVFKTAVTGQKLCYELATPVSIQLTPQEITALVGVNNVFGDTDGNTSVDYFNSIAGNVEELIDMLIPHDASELDYDNTVSGLQADNVQEAIDEVAGGLGDMNTATLLWTGDMYGNNSQATIPNLSDWLIVGYSVDENEDFYISIGTAGRGGSNYVQYQGSNIQLIAHRFDVNGNTISATQTDQGISFSGGTTYNGSASCHVRKVYGLLKKPTISNS